MIVMPASEVEVFQKLNGEHDDFWREQYQSYRPTMKEQVWDWCSDHQTVLTILVAALFVLVLVFAFFHPMVFALGLLALIVGLVGYMIWSLASGAVQAFLDWLM